MLYMAVTALFPSSYGRADHLDLNQQHQESRSDQGPDPKHNTIFGPKHKMEWSACTKSCEKVLDGLARNKCVAHCTDFEMDE